MKTSRNPAPPKPQIAYAPFERGGKGAKPRGVLKVYDEMAASGLTPAETVFVRNCIRRLQAAENLSEMANRARAAVLADIERVPAAAFLKGLFQGAKN